MPDQVYVANTSGASEVDGENYVYVKGVSRVAEGHPLLKAVPDYFDEVKENLHSETATMSFTATAEEMAEAERQQKEAEAAAQAEAEAAKPDATPAAEALAEEMGVDLSGVEGTGTDGRITKDDVSAAVEALQTSGNGEGNADEGD